LASVIVAPMAAMIAATITKDGKNTSIKTAM